MVNGQIAFALCTIFLILGVARAQDRLDKIVPLESIKDDVVAIMGAPSQVDESGRFIYDLDDREVSVAFYNGGCESIIGTNFGLRSGSVVEVKSSPKRRAKLTSFLADRSQYKAYSAHGGSKLYYNPAAGRVITVWTENATEFVKDLFRIGPQQSLDKCLARSVGDDSALGELHYFGAMSGDDPLFKFPPLQIGGYFHEDSEEGKREVIADFVKELSSRPNAVGLVILNGALSDPSSQMERRKSQLLEVLRKEGIKCNKLAIQDGIRGGLSGVSFAVVHKSFIKESKMKMLCP